MIEGKENIAIGLKAMGSEDCTGDHNVAIGPRALYNLRSGSYNVAIGADALIDVTDEDYQIQIGSVRLAGDDPELAKKLTEALYEWIVVPLNRRPPLFPLLPRGVSDA
jgi:hypothetical protein